MRFFYLLILYIFISFKSFGQEPPPIIEQDDLVIEFSKIDSVTFRPYYDDFKIRDSIAAPFNNRYRESVAIESYLLDHLDLPILIDGPNRHIVLSTGDTLSLIPDPEQFESAFSFDAYLKDYGYYLFRVQWPEGNDYCLINIETGTRIDLFGKAYFSPNGKFLISVNKDLMAGYSNNGIQLFEFLDGTYSKIWQLTPDWGPSNAEWLDKNRLMIEKSELYFEEGFVYYYSYYIMTINKP